jgi:hypothetical protein
MSLIKPLLAFFPLICCINTFAQTQQDIPAPPFTQKDTTYWVYNFRQFRDAVYQNDIAKAKSFMDFPFIDENNEIWYLAYDFSEPLTNKLGGNVKPFTEGDFHKYFNRLFPKSFINCLLKIKTDTLYKEDSYETRTFEDSLASTSYKMYVTLDRSESTLTLNLASQPVYRHKEDEDQDGGEFNIIYLFKITRKGHIKLQSVRLAG